MAEPTANVPPQEMQVARSSSAGSTHAPVLLLVEDDPIDVLAVQRVVLEKLGWRVHAAPSLAYARTLLSSMTFDAVLLDLHLADGQGTELLPEICDLPVVCLTGTGDEATAVLTMKGGAIDYLVKDAHHNYLDRLPGSLLQARERHALRRLEQQLSTLNHIEPGSLHDLAVHLGDLLYVRGPTGTLNYVSPLARRILGIEANDLEGTDLDWQHLVPEEWGSRWLSQSSTSASFEYPIDHPERGRLWLHERRFSVRAEADGRLLRVVGVVRDITERREAELSLQRRAELAADMALRDPLTGLWNRRGLEDLLNREIRIRRRSEHRICLALIDCDNFKAINDSYGHDAGDQALSVIADRIRQTLRPADIVGRVGGDEFMVILPDTRPGEGFKVAERIRKAVSLEPIEYRDRTFQATVSIGVVSVPAETETFQQAQTLVDVSLRGSKRGGKNCVTLADHLAATIADGTSRLDDQSSFHSVAQPIRHLGDRFLAGYELFSRGPQGCESPALFFALAVAQDRLGEVDFLCLRNSLDIIRTQIPLSDPTLQFHVNVHPGTMASLSEDAWGVLLQGIPMHRVCIEICEQELVGVPYELHQRRESLRNLGLKVALDDVGFGRSCLEALLMLEPDVIKVDRTLVQECDQDDGRRRMLDRMLAIGTSFKATVIPEGIETDAELQTLRSLGFELGQGYLLGRPASL